MLLVSFSKRGRKTGPSLPPSTRSCITLKRCARAHGSNCQLCGRARQPCASLLSALGLFTILDYRSPPVLLSQDPAQDTGRAVPALPIAWEVPQADSQH